jgi:hypothetical protein
MARLSTASREIPASAQGTTWPLAKVPVRDAHTEELTDTAEMLPWASAVNVTLVVLIKFALGMAEPLILVTPLSRITKLLASCELMSSVDNCKFGVSLEG